ncbi:MAG: hypothetical protein U9R74_17820 [Pseudomonadota bacterium]|nr:hypothetical protein [Pseudomonadota bacterium]
MRSPPEFREAILRRTACCAAFLTLAIYTSGCTIISKQYGAPLDTSKIQPGDGPMDYRDALRALGPPARITALPGGFGFLYESLYIKERQIGLRGNGDVLRFFKLAFGDADLERRTIQLVFDESGMLRAHASDVDLDPIGKGVGMQIFYQVQPVVDTRDLELTYVDPLLWGLSQLQPLPETLNVGQSLDSGAAGFEMRGTPVAAGQRTLEMRQLGRKK